MGQKNAPSDYIKNWYV